MQDHLTQEDDLRAVGYPELFDATGASTILTSDQVRTLVRRTHDLVRRGPFGPTAIVATNDMLFGMARMYEILAETDGVSVGVFRTLADADRWLRGNPN